MALQSWLHLYWALLFWRFSFLPLSAVVCLCWLHVYFVNCLMKYACLSSVRSLFRSLCPWASTVLDLIWLSARIWGAHHSAKWLFTSQVVWHGQAKMKLSNFTGHYQAFRESQEYFCIAQFFMFWESLLTHLLTELVLRCVFGSFQGEGGWCLFCVLFSMLHWLELISSSGRLLQVPGQR